MRISQNSSSCRHEALAGYLFLLPSLIGVCTLLVFPMADTVRRSFVTASGQWNGLNNYQAVLSNASFRLAAWNTFRFLITAVPLLLILSLGAALAVRRAPAFVKSSFLVPLALPVASFAWGCSGCKACPGLCQIEFSGPAGAAGRIVCPDLARTV